MTTFIQIGACIIIALCGIQIGILIERGNNDK